MDHASLSRPSTVPVSGEVALVSCIAVVVTRLYTAVDPRTLPQCRFGARRGIPKKNQDGHRAPREVEAARGVLGESREGGAVHPSKNRLLLCPGRTSAPLCVLFFCTCMYVRMTQLRVFFFFLCCWWCGLFQRQQRMNEWMNERMNE